MGSSFFAYMWLCFYNYGAPLGGPSDRRGSATSIVWSAGSEVYVEDVFYVI